MPLRLAKTTFILSVIIIVTLAAMQAQAGDWPNYRGANYDGISTETDWQSGWSGKAPKVLWEKSVGTGFSSITALGKIIPFRTFQAPKKTKKKVKNQDVVYCFDAKTGEEIWKHAYDCPLGDKLYEGGPGATPTINDGHVYTFSQRGHLYCFKADTGEVVV